MTTATRRNVAEWEQMLHDMNEARENCSIDEGDNDFQYVWLPLENDDDMIPLAQALRNLHNRDRESVNDILVEIFTGFTERGAHFLAEGLRDSNVTNVRVITDGCGEETDSVGIVRILYLEGNQPNFETDCERTDFALHLLSLQRKEADFTTCSVWLFCLDGGNGALLGNLLQGNSSVKDLTFMGVGAQNVTAESAQAVAEGIRLSKVKRLNFDFGNEGNEELLRILCQEGIKACGRLIEVNGRVSQATELADILSSLSALRIESESVFTMKHPVNEIVPLNIGLFNEGLRQTSSLVSLTLSNCVVGVEGMKNVSLALRDNRSVQSLRLPYNYISDEGIIEFVRNWHEDSRLGSLQLHRNDLSPEGLRHLLPAVANHRSMYELDVSANRNIGLLGLQLIGNEMHNMTLRWLDISQCFEAKELTDEESDDAIEAYELEKAKTRRCVVDGLKSNFYLCDLRFHDNDDLFDDVSDEFRFYMDLNRCGRHILANGCGLPPTVWCHILAKCSSRKHFAHRHSLTFYFLVEQPMLLSGYSGMNRKRSRVA